MKIISVNDKLQKNYSYSLCAAMGEDFREDFKPQLTPKEMLNLGVFGGKYLTDCQNEFPSDWFKNAKLNPARKDIELNYYNIDASQSLTEWQRKGWIFHEDPRGWFQWYCRYFLGRRIDYEDDRQIKRWRAFSRHVGAVKKNCDEADWSCRRRQRQALLHWAYDSRII